MSTQVPRKPSPARRATAAARGVRPGPLARIGLAVLSALLLVLGVSSLAQASPPDPAATVKVPVSFTVRNVNRSMVACPSDGRTYTVRGQMVGPASKMTSAAQGQKLDAATLYLHGLSFGEFFYDYPLDSSYNYAAAQAALGNVSVVVDRLGYGASDKPNGNQICVGSRADIAHQMVTDLRTGSYLVDNHAGPSFGKIALAGHSYGGQIAQVEAYSFGDIDGLVVLAYADRVQSELLAKNAAYATRVCADGGLRVGGTGPTGYAPFGPPSGALSALFSSAPSRIQLATKQLLSIDPCGDVASFAKATRIDLNHVDGIKVPVLVVGGGADKLFPPPAAQDQAQLFTGSSSVTHVTLPNAAHALTLEVGHDRLVNVVDQWLHQHVTS